MRLSGWFVVLAGVTVLPVEAQSPPVTWPAEVAAWDRTIRVERLVGGLSVVSALARLPDGRLLVAERPVARLSLLDPATGASAALGQVSPTFTAIGAGLQDVAVHPDFEADPWVYLSYTDTALGGGTTLVLDRARLVDGRLLDRARLFEASPGYATDDHYGGRIAFDDGMVFLAMGDRLTRDSAQVLSNHTGKIVRLHDDGRVPRDNPLVGRAGARPEIWSYGHRHPQGLIVDARTRRLWSHEHGPRGGDELNLIEPGANFGWPVVSWGGEYEGGPVGDGRTHHPGTAQPLWLWRPSIAPSGLLQYTGEAFPEWRGAFLVGAMAGRHLNVLRLDGTRVIHEERLLSELRLRVRAIAQGADGFVYLGVDEGMVLRLRPAG